MNRQQVETLFQGRSDAEMTEEGMEVLKTCAQALGLRPTRSKLEMVHRIRAELLARRAFEGQRALPEVEGGPIPIRNVGLGLENRGQQPLAQQPVELDLGLGDRGQHPVAAELVLGNRGLQPVAVELGLGNQGQQPVVINGVVPSGNQVQQPVGEMEQRIAAMVSAEVGKIRKDIEAREGALMDLVGSVGVSSASDRLWAPKVFGDGMRQEFYDDLCRVGRLVTKLEAGMFPSREEVQQTKKLTQLWMTRTALEEEVGSEFAALVGRGFEGSFMEPFAKEIKEARKIYMKAVPGSISVGNFGKSGLVGTGVNSNRFLPGSFGTVNKQVAEKRKGCFQCGSVDHIARFCPRQFQNGSKRARGNLKVMESPSGGSKE